MPAILSENKIQYDITYRQLTDERIHKALYEYLDMLDGIKQFHGEIHIMNEDEKVVKINKEKLETRISRVHRLISEIRRLGERQYFEIIDETKKPV